ncbi:hypothetical protein DL766_008153 [Monosporascus sp. MC13-8B]|uniref:Carboxylic ester hydrolase n=1 Tax=Monosporascus cannonballus TaxID=155416 RepID=A0ABY0GQZ7_9PEZI|nr:hypothetical protein DL762_010281 [Monosporascus cannonballus]RYO81454.1 hypothetical protein DL763_008581 [Monosporascus cannonballus]RYP20602.1 hypothetical protein DL766_008153 [Monosporascus sp. MC13-8B]
MAPAHDVPTDVEKTGKTAAGEHEGDHHLKDAIIDIVAASSAAEKALLWRQDKRIVPLSAAIYFLCYLDRSNIGNAKVLNSSTGDDMQTDTRMSNYQFNIALMIFLIGYFLFEVPSNILLKKLRPSRWIAFLMFSWGAISAGLGGTHNFGQVTGVRFLLGAFEAGLFPGLVYYLTFWYKTNERSVRVAFILASATLAGAFGGAIAYGVGHMNMVGGLPGWRWLFILEAIPSMVSAFFVWFLLPDYPERASWLSESEKDLAAQRLHLEGAKGSAASLTWAETRATLTDWRLYGHYAIYFAVSLPFSSLSLFTPSIVSGLGYFDLQAQLMTVPPWAVAYVCQIIVSWLGDHFNARAYACAGAAAVGAIGFLVSALLPAAEYAGRYGCLIVGAAGAFSCIPPMLGWLTSNMWSTASIGLAVALNVSIGAGLGQIPGVWIYKADEAARGYPTGHGVNCAMLFFVSLGALALRYYYALRNGRILAAAEGGPVPRLCLYYHHHPPPPLQSRRPESSTDETATDDRCNISTFLGPLPPNATLENVTAVPQGRSYGEGAANLAYPVDPADLPALCAVTAWNRRFLTVGNGGFGGGINWLEMGVGTRYGFAALSTDTGHNSTATQLEWALGRPSSRTDWGWRTMRGSVELGKRLVEAYYAGNVGNSDNNDEENENGNGGRTGSSSSSSNSVIRYSYFSGCSTGGRQGLKEVQISPGSFDGVLVGAPAWYTSRLNNWATKVAQWDWPADSPRHAPWTALRPLAREVSRRCDGADGVRDGIVSAPERCALDFLARLACGASGASAEDLTTATPQSESPGLLPGSEWTMHVVLNYSGTSPYAIGYERYFVLDDPGLGVADFNDSVVELSARSGPGGATADDYGAIAGIFRESGGKVLMYHGMADALVPTRGSDLYYNRTVEAMEGMKIDRGGDLNATRDFFRYFLVPGMQHCRLTDVDAPWAFGAAYQALTFGNRTYSVPGFEGDAGYDVLMALVDWVERGVPVDSFVATTWRSATDPSSGVLRQRPICAYPKVAAWDGVGDVDRTDSWSCADNHNTTTPVTGLAAQSMPNPVSVRT